MRHTLDFDASRLVVFRFLSKHPGWKPFSLDSLGSGAASHSLCDTSFIANDFTKLHRVSSLKKAGTKSPHLKQTAGYWIDSQFAILDPQ